MMISRSKVSDAQFSPRYIAWARLYSIILLFCSLSLPVAAEGKLPLTAPTQHSPPQHQSDSLQHYFREQWSTRDGLPHNTINNIVQTDDGYLWFATWEGIARFNGRHFKVFDRNEATGLPDSGIFALHAADDNRLLAGGSRGGFVKVHHGSWHAYPPADALVRAVLEDSQGRIWLATESAGLWRQEPDGQRYRITSPAQGLNNEAMYSLAEDANGAIWVGTAEGLFFIQHDQVEHITHDLPRVPVFSIVTGYQEQVVIGTEQGVYIGDAQQGFQLLDKTLTMATSALLPDDKDLWIGTVSHGLFRYHQSSLEALGTDDGKPSNRILSLLKDQQGSLWVGTNGGLFRLRHAPFTSLNHQHGLADDFVRAVLPLADGSVLAGTSRGVDRIENDRIQPFTHPSPLLRESILSIAQDANGTLWFGSYSHGLFSIDTAGKEQHFTREHGLWTNEVRAILPAEDGSLWIGTSRGLNRWHQGQIERYDMDSGLPGNYIMALYQTADQRVWIGTGSGVAYHANQTFTTIDLQQQDGAEFAFGFLEIPHHQHLWMTTDRGLVRYDQANGHLAIIGRQAGLPFDKYFQVVLDQQEHLWLSSNRGMLRIELSAANALLAGELSELPVDHFAEADGMHSAQANGGSNPAAALHPDGSVWVATAGGVIMTRPETLASFSEFIPPIVIEDIRVDGEPSSAEALQALPAGTQRIELHYAGLAYVMSQHIRYRTRLQGFDHDWIERGHQPYTELTNLPPGHYQFKVIAAYPDGEWSPQPATLAIYIAPYLWQRPGFWLSILLLSILGVVGLIRWRLYRLQQAAAHLQQQVAEKTIELQLKADHLQQSNQEKSELLEQLRMQSEAFARQARQDSLTGLANRRVFDEALSQEFKRTKRHQHPLCLVLIDIDHFKQVNDNWSHAIGDQVLIRVAASLQEQCRNTDIVARWGGEEFALLLPETGLPEVMQFCDRLRAEVSRLDFSDVASGLAITISIGVADSMRCQQPEALLSQADKALYQAKSLGRNQVCVAGE